MKKATITDILAIGFVLLVLGGIFGSLIWQLKDEKKHPEKYLNSCQISCKKLGYKYLQLNSGGFGSPSCWCIHNGKSERVW